MAARRNRAAPSEPYNGGPASYEKMLERIHHNLYARVEEAVKPIMHLESNWSEGELVKRVVRYIYNGAKSEDLLNQPWQEAVKNLVDKGMSTYQSACQEKQWFFEIDLAPAFTAAVWEILRRGGRPNAAYERVEEMVITEYEDKLDRILHTKAIWDATAKTFQDAKIQGKVNAALFKAYESALDICLMDSRPLDDLNRVELFTRRWIEDSMQRAWNSCPDSERNITEGNVTRLFGNLVAPFGDHHPFTCIPGHLVENIGRPPRDWTFIRQAVRNMFTQWKHQESGSSAAKKRRKKNHEVSAEDLIVDDQPEEFEAREEPRAPVDGPPGEGGHPECTSKEDCIGDPECRLVQHLLDGDPGDIYCQACWDSFLDQNKGLQAVFMDTNEPYE